MKISRRILSLVLTVFLMGSCLSVTAFAAANEIVSGIGFVTASALRLRSAPDASSSIMDTALKNECVVVLRRDGEWYKVNYNLQIGYMHSSYLRVLSAENAELGYGTVSGSSVNLRKGPGTGYAVVTSAPKGSRCYILGVNQGWYKVIYGSQICYIRSDYLTLTEIPYENPDSVNTPKFYRLGKSTGVAPSAAALNGSTAAPSGGSGVSGVTGKQILTEAQKYLGVPYVNGGASPSGFDCSGLVYYVLKTLGYAPYRTAADQYNMGKSVAKAELQPGDIAFFAGTYGSGISHVGIYAGNGQFIHSPNSRSTVSYSDLTTGYWAEHYFGARRMTS